MLTPYGVGCAYVCMGTWSSLQGVSIPTFLFLGILLILSYTVAI